MEETGEGRRKRKKVGEGWKREEKDMLTVEAGGGLRKSKKAGEIRRRLEKDCGGWKGRIKSWKDGRG